MKESTFNFVKKKLMIFNELKKREIPFNVCQAYNSMGRTLNTETRVYSIIVLNQFAPKLEGLISSEFKDGFYYSDYENIYCYEMSKGEKELFMELRLPLVFSSIDGAFYGDDLRKFKLKNK